jgi:tRNA(fMet)-specific endonuclease VapC
VDEHYAKIRAMLEAAGNPIGPNDLLIAAHARALGLTLVTHNLAEFSRVAGLTLENWLEIR